MTGIWETTGNIGEFLRSAVDVLLTLSAYWSLLLIRCAFVSVPLIVAVRLIRRLIPDRYTWVRAWCWSLLFLAPCFGKLHFWYDQPMAWRVTGFLYDLLGHHFVLRILLPGFSACLIIRFMAKERRLRKEIDPLPKEQIADVTISVTPLAVSPFSAGLIRPRIIIPKKHIQAMDEHELKNIILHERTHIRLGHLWIFALWRLLCALLFPNILLFRSGKDLREDMEALCDRVTMNHTQIPAAEYGRLILRSHRFAADDNDLSPVTLSGERTYDEARRRILRICAFKPYRLKECVLLGLSVVFVVAGTFILILQASYPKWSDNPCISIVDQAGHVQGYYDEEAIENAVFWDREKLLIHRTAFEIMRAAYPSDVDPEHFWICFDGFYKMPGIGGGGQLVEVDLSGEEEDLIIPYEWTTDFWTEFFRYI